MESMKKHFERSLWFMEMIEHWVYETISKQGKSNYVHAVL